MGVHTCGGRHKSALALQSICARISQEECMAVKCRYNICTYTATEYSQARKCTHKHWRMIRCYILGSSQTHNLERLSVTLCVVHNCTYITELLQSVTIFVWKKILVYMATLILLLLYVGHLESKERLRIQPAQLFHFSWWVMWCVQ